MKTTLVSVFLALGHFSTQACSSPIAPSSSPSLSLIKRGQPPSGSGSSGTAAAPLLDNAAIPATISPSSSDIPSINSVATPLPGMNDIPLPSASSQAAASSSGAEEPNDASNSIEEIVSTTIIAGAPIQDIPPPPPSPPLPSTDDAAPPSSEPPSLAATAPSAATNDVITPSLHPPAPAAVSPAAALPDTAVLVSIETMEDAARKAAAAAAAAKQAAYAEKKKQMLIKAKASADARREAHRLINEIDDEYDNAATRAATRKMVAEAEALDRAQAAAAAGGGGGGGGGGGESVDVKPDSALKLSLLGRKSVLKPAGQRRLGNVVVKPLIKRPEMVITGTRPTIRRKPAAQDPSPITVDSPTLAPIIIEYGTSPEVEASVLVPVNDSNAAAATTLPILLLGTTEAPSTSITMPADHSPSSATSLVEGVSEPAAADVDVDCSAPAPLAVAPTISQPSTASTSPVGPISLPSVEHDRSASISTASTTAVLPPISKSADGSLAAPLPGVSPEGRPARRLPMLGGGISSSSRIVKPATSSLHSKTGSGASPGIKAIPGLASSPPPALVSPKKATSSDAGAGRVVAASSPPSSLIPSSVAVPSLIVTAAAGEADVPQFVVVKTTEDYDFVLEIHRTRNRAEETPQDFAHAVYPAVLSSSSADADVDARKQILQVVTIGFDEEIVGIERHDPGSAEEQMARGPIYKTAMLPFHIGAMLR